MASCALENGSILDGFCAVELPITIVKPRSVKVEADSGRIFVLERGIEAIVELVDTDGDGIPDTKEFVVFAEGLNHGLALFGGYVYASSDTTVYRWPLFDLDTGEPLGYPLPDEPEIIVANINEDGQGGAPRGHTTRTIAFDEPSGNMYVSVGSNKNVDADSHRSRIRRTSTMESSSLPLDFQTMEVFADGLRNEVGLAFDKHGILWGVENSADNLFREDLGGDIHQDNPAEELNRFDPSEDAGKHYGYPYCWTEYELPKQQGQDQATTGIGRGTVWAWPSFFESGTITDETCRDEYVPPTMSLQGHSAPLGITFFQWIPPEERGPSCSGIASFPKDMDGYAFVAYHGSWNRDIPTGYKVVYIEMDGDGNPMGEQPIDLLAHKAPNAQWEDGFRPVDVAFDVCGRLIVTSDGTKGRGSKVVRIDYSLLEANNSDTAGAGTTSGGESSSGFVGGLEAARSPLESTIFLCLLLLQMMFGS